MKYKVVGWTYYEDDLPENECWSAHHAVVDEIRNKGYLFTGYHHQEYIGCVPVLNDGTKSCDSRRSWRNVITEAYNQKGAFAYAKYSEYSYDHFLKPLAMQQSDAILQYSTPRVFFAKTCGSFN